LTWALGFIFSLGMVRPPRLQVWQFDDKRRADVCDCQSSSVGHQTSDICRQIFVGIGYLEGKRSWRMRASPSIFDLRSSIFDLRSLPLNCEFSSFELPASGLTDDDFDFELWASSFGL
jgi:hypothetical protein